MLKLNIAAFWEKSTTLCKKDWSSDAFCLCAETLTPRVKDLLSSATASALRANTFFGCIIFFLAYTLHDLHNPYSQRTLLMMFYKESVFLRVSLLVISA